MMTIKLELGIDAQKFIQQIQLHNQTVEEQIARGIELALNDICNGDTFVESIREATKQELAVIVNKTVMSWEVKNKIGKMVAEKVEFKISDYAEKIADKITESLK